ncbi:B3 domain-containing protein, partial [Ananas comosus]
MSPSLSYEDLRNKKLQENKRKLEELKLSHLSVALRDASSPKPSPSKSVKRKALQEQRLVAVRRSVRVANLPEPPTYREDVKLYLVTLFSYRPCKRRDLSNRVYASDEERMYAETRAEEVEAELGSEFPTFVKPMLQSHVTGGFWLGLSKQFCNKYLPKRDSTITLVDEEDEEFDTVYLANKRGLSGGWRGFSLHHELVDGDALVFQLIEPARFK